MPGRGRPKGSKSSSNRTSGTRNRGPQTKQAGARQVPDDQVEILPAWQMHDWTVEEVKFASEFLRTGNKSASWRAVYPDTSAAYSHMGANKLLAQPWMASYLAEINDAIRSRMSINKDNVLAEIAKLGFANFSDFVILNADGQPVFDMSGLTRDQMAAIAELTIDTYVVGKGDPMEGREVRSVKMKLAPKLGALEALGKHLKLFTDVVEHNVVDVADEVRRAREARQARRLARQEEEQSGSD